jgi:DNA transformation protein
MALSKEFQAFAEELLQELAPIQIKRMFGGAAAYRDGRIFALLDDDAIWIKVDEVNEAQFADQGLPRMTYPMKDGRIMDMAYRRLPDSALDDPSEAARWARLGIEAAARKPEKKASKKKAAKAG